MSYDFSVIIDAIIDTIGCLQGDLTALVIPSPANSLLPGTCVLVNFPLSVCLSVNIILL